MVLDDEFDELRREFLDEAAGKIREIRDLYQEKFPPEKQQVERITYLAHQLKGAGGSYGFPEISRDAAELEEEVEAAAGGKGDLREAISARISRLEETVRSQLQELAGSR